MKPWIKTSERLPEQEQNVWVFGNIAYWDDSPSDTKTVRAAVYYGEQFLCRYPLAKCTHWQPLEFPEPPEDV